MKVVGPHPIPTCEFIHSTYGISIPPIDIEAVTMTTDSDWTLEDTTQLEDEALEVGERVYFFAVGSERLSVGVRCFTQAENELDNFCTYGDVIFLDGTAIDNPRQDTLPLTLLDRNRQIP
jgi:hypothetical protein